MRLTRRTFLKLGASAMVSGFGGIAYSTLVEPGLLSVERVTARLPRLPTSLNGFRIAALGDFHLHPFTKLPHIQKAIRATNALNADLVVLLGDYIDATVEAVHELSPALSALNARLGVFGVLGNHDHWKGAEIVRNSLENVGIRVLQNSGVSLTTSRTELFLAGLESAWAGHPDLTVALSKRRSEVTTIALVHEPDFADTTAADGRVALQISGHSHGGQVRLPLIGALELPSWGRRYDHGMYRLKNLALYTNRGIGLVDIPVRFNCPPEVTEITLRGA